MFRKRSFQERFWEVLPGLQFWFVFFGAFALSYYQPTLAALFIICFDLYWVLKAVNVASHLMASYRKFKFFVTIDWLEYVKKLSDYKSYAGFLEEKGRAARKPVVKTYYGQEAARIRRRMAEGKTGADFSGYYHLVLIPFVDESFEVLDSTLQALAQTNYPKDKMMVILASEERAGEPAQEVGRRVREKFGGVFHRFFISAHPDGLAGEIKGKSANASFAVQWALPELEKMGIGTDRVLVSNFDSDTIVHPQYFARVIYEFLTAEKPYQSSYQPIAVYNNNIWDSPAIIRVVSVSNSFWQFTESSRPDRLRTFSSHTMTLRALIDVGFWKKDIVNEDGYIYWQCYLKYRGDYQVVPLFIPISLDTCLAPTTWQTLKNQYKQKRRWAYNVEYYPHLVPALLKSKAPLRDRLYKLYQYIEGNFNWATASIMISTLGWLPLFLGGAAFQQSVVAYNLPFATKTLMNVALFFLIFSVYINMVLLPPRPKKYSAWRSVAMYLQWFLVPIASVVFGSLPAVEAQTRLMLGNYLEFWVTPKARKGESTGLSMKEMGGSAKNPADHLNI
ncbi:MAG TPA: glycosyltransferase family 2 protein [Patescibacteria group bacterium]|nr:glycosyltransferase family 2 protein [Patescibacteria group bacterium]